jgi:hypothetical protein
VNWGKLWKNSRVKTDNLLGNVLHGRRAFERSAVCGERNVNGSATHRYVKKTPTRNFFIPEGWQRVAAG